MCSHYDKISARSGHGCCLRIHHCLDRCYDSWNGGQQKRNSRDMTCMLNEPCDSKAWTAQ